MSSLHGDGGGFSSVHAARALQYRKLTLSRSTSEVLTRGFGSEKRGAKGQDEIVNVKPHQVGRTIVQRLRLVKRDVPAQVDVQRSERRELCEWD
jgi:hypothetical protein